MPCRKNMLAVALLACGAPLAFAQDAMTPTTTVDPAAQTTPETRVDPERPLEQRSPVDPALQDPPATPATPTPPTTPTTPGAPATPAPGGTDTAVLMQDGQEVRVRSRQPDSVVGEYRIDFAALDANDDGHISRAEARSNPSMTAEFHVADSNGDGRLSREEASGWTR